MKKHLLWMLLWVVVLAPLPGLGASTVALQSLQPDALQGATARLVTAVLARNHYNAPPFDHAAAAKVFDNYIQVLDPEKLFFLQRDIDVLSVGRSTLDDAIRADDISLPFKVYDTYRERLTERFTYARELLNTPPNFTEKESYEYDRRTARWLRTDDEVRELWRKRVKNDWLSLKIAGQTDEAIRKTLDKRYEGYLTRVSKSKSSDVFQTFMDTYATSIDPHTNYLSPRDSEEFDISMKLSLIGIGAILQTRDDYTTIRELVPGGPAARSGKLKVGDRIVGVGQGTDAPITEVLGWRLDDVVSVIRGQLDSTVVLDILPEGAAPGAKHKSVALIRKKISIEQQAAKKSIIEVKEGATPHRIGVITLPLFYEDFEGRRTGDKAFKSASRDVARLIDELKKDKIEGLIMDLRNNGGGSLAQAIEITGLFIDRGPVVQERDAEGRIQVQNDPVPGYAWNGPLAVLINRSSASASEIFAAAIQDYGRGLILGETSFGKGTVQNKADLNQIVRVDKPAFGGIKYTIAQFFRVNGSTTQRLGVKPDIPFPEFSDLKRLGESSYDNALPSTQIKAADYVPTGDLAALVPQLRERHEARMASNKALKRVAQNAIEIARLRNRTSISLNEAERRAERDAIDARTKDPAELAARAKNKRQAGKNKPSDAPSRESSIDPDEPPKLSPKEEQARKAREPDAILLKESAQILGDELDLLARNAKLAEKVLPRTAMSTRIR